MKLLCTGLLVLGVLAQGTAFAQVDVLMKKKAHAIANSGATRGAEPSDPSQRTAGTPASTAGGAGGAAQGTPNYQKLLADLAIVKFRSEVTPDLTKRLSTDLALAAVGGVKPSDAAIARLANDLAAGLVHKKFSTEDQTTLAQNIVAALNSAALSAADTQSALKSAQSVMRGGQVGDAEVKVIIDDLAAIVGDLQKDGKPAAK